MIEFVFTLFSLSSYRVMLHIQESPYLPYIHESLDSFSLPGRYPTHAPPCTILLLHQVIRIRDIRLGPLGKLGSEFRVGEACPLLLSPPRRVAQRFAAVDGLKVIGVLAEVEAGGSRVAANIGVPGAYFDVGGRQRGLLEPVLGRRVAVVEDDGRQTGKGIRLVRQAVLASGLVCHVLDEDRVAHARGAGSVQVSLQVGLADVGGSECCHGTAQGVAGDNYGPRRICGSDSLNALEDSG